MVCPCTETIIIYASSVLAVIWALYNAFVIRSIKIDTADKDDEESQPLNDREVKLLLKIGEKISKGANSFLFQEYSIMGVFIVLFSIVVLLIVDILQGIPKF